MNICLFSPYIPKHTGGGEKYLFDVAEVLSQRHSVSVAISEREFSNADEIRRKYESFLDTSLAAVNFFPTPLGSDASFLSKLLWTKQFDVMYYLTDGSLFFSLATRNILHIQFPLQLNKSGIVEQLKLKNWYIKNTNSEFTKSVVESSWPAKINMVHHPKVDVDKIKNLASDTPKEKIILAVGRFFRQLHSKRQDILVKIFTKLRENPEARDWKLVLIGTVEDESYLEEVKALAAGLPIQIITDVERPELLKWYSRASIFWHAAGYDVDEHKFPEKVEHFGISTVEAMSAGCVPVVHGKGGQREVIGDQLVELMWLTVEDCVEKTIHLIKDSRKRSEMSEKVQRRAAVFGPEIFAQKLWEMIGEES